MAHGEVYPYQLPNWQPQGWDEYLAGLEEEDRNAWLEANPDYFDPNWQQENYMGTIPNEAWYQQRGLADYGISLEEYQNAYSRWFNEIRPSGQGFSNEERDNLWLSVFGADAQFWMFALDVGGYGVEPQLDLGQFDIYEGVSGDTNVLTYFARHEGHPDEIIAYNYEDAYAWAVANDRPAGAGYPPPVYGGFAPPPIPQGPPAPAWMAIDEITPLTPGQHLLPAPTKLASGQTLKKFNPSQLKGLGGFINWSAGQVQGAPASFEDWYYRSEQLLPKTSPRGTVRWAPSGGY